MKNLKTIIQPLVFALIFTVGIGYAVAWTGPQNTPPNCVSGQPGCDAPINVSGVFQAKAGALHLGSANPPVSFRTLAGQSAFGTSAAIPATLRALFSGNVGAAMYCDEGGNNCHASSEIGGGVKKIIAGSNITITPTGGTGDVTINSSGSGSGGVPSGAIMAFDRTVSTCPTSWTFVPGLRGKNIIGANATYPVGSTGGSLTDSVKIVVSNLPPHEHLVNGKIVHNGGSNIGKTSGNDDTRGEINTEPQIYDAFGNQLVSANGTGQTNVTVDVLDPYVAYVYCRKD